MSLSSDVRALIARRDVAEAQPRCACCARGPHPEPAPAGSASAAAVCRADRVPTMIDVRPLADEPCPRCGQECTLQRVAPPVYHPEDDQTPRTPLRTGRWRGTCAACGDFECGGEDGGSMRDPLVERLLRLHEAQHLHLLSPSFLLEQRFRCRFTTSFLMLLFTATRLEQDAGAVLKITRVDLAALLHCSPRTAQAAAQEAEAAGWCHHLPQGYALTLAGLGIDRPPPITDPSPARVL